MSGENNAAVVHRPNGGKDRRFVAVGIRHSHEGYIEFAEVIFDELDQRQVRLGAFRVEADEPLDQGNRAGKGVRGGGGHGARLASDFGSCPLSRSRTQPSVRRLRKLACVAASGDPQQTHLPLVPGLHCASLHASEDEALRSIRIMSSSERPKWWPISCTSTCVMMAPSVSSCSAQ